jgi:hypothetical protein
MVNEMIKEISELQDEFCKKGATSFSEEELTQIKNYLTQISLSVDKMTLEKEEIYKSINQVRSILRSHDNENKNS